MQTGMTSVDRSLRGTAGSTKSPRLVRACNVIEEDIIKTLTHEPGPLCIATPSTKSAADQGKPGIGQLRVISRNISSSDSLE